VTSRHQAGFSLAEVLVGMLIGLLLLAAFLATLDRCRASFAAGASVASLHDNTRHAWSVLAADLEHAGFLGFAGAARPELARGGAVIAAAEALWQPDENANVPPVMGLPAGAHDCGGNFAVDITVAVQVTNNSWPRSGGTRCAPTASAGGARAGSDTLTLRRASLETTTPRAGRLQLYGRRLQSQLSATLFGDGAAPGPLDENSEVRDLEVHTYYIANDSIGRPGWPALRAKSLTESAGAAQFRDEEILPGVEDLQVELRLWDAATGTATRMNEDDLELRRNGMQVLAVHVWMRIRADHTESGFRDPRPLRYADVEFHPDSGEARMRRALVERTVTLRNLRAP
jgi:hypothetical protein